VPDAGHDRDAAGPHGVGHALIVEGPQVFQAAAAPHQQDHVHVLAVEALQSGHDLRRRFLPLDERRAEHDLRQREAAAEHVEHVLKGGGSGRSDYADAAREGGQGALDGRVEQPFRLQAGLEGLEAGVEVAAPGGLEQVGVELVLAAGLVDGDVPVHQHAVALARLVAQAQGVAFPHHAFERGGLVLEGKIPVAGARRGEVADLALHPDILQAQIGVKQVADVGGQAGDGVGVGSIEQGQHSPT